MDKNAYRMDGLTATIQSVDFFKMCFHTIPEHLRFTLDNDNNNVTEISDQDSDAHYLICTDLILKNMKPEELKNLKIKFDPEILQHFPNLRSISFCETRGLELALSDLRGLNNLTKLTIMEGEDNIDSDSENKDSRGVHLVNSNLEELAKISKNLKELKLNIIHNELRGTLDSLKSLTKLTKFWFEANFNEEDQETGVGNSINGDIDQFLKDHSALTDLHITGTDVHGIVKVSSLRDANSQLCNCFYKLNNAIKDAKVENCFELQGFLKENNGGQECIVKNDSDSSEDENYGLFGYSRSEIENIIFTDVNDVNALCDSINLYTEADEQNGRENNSIMVDSPQVLKFFFNILSLKDEEVLELNDIDCRETIKLYLAYRKKGGAKEDVDEESDVEENYYTTDTTLVLDSGILKNFPQLQSINFQHFPGFVLNLTDFADLPNLKTLILNTYIIGLARSKLEDVQKISPKLEKLEIGGEIFGNLSSLAALTELKELCLKGQRNGYQGSLADLSNLTNLERLEIMGGNVYGSLASLQNLTNLKSLMLMKVPNISGNIEDLSVLANLEDLKLEGEITGDIEQFRERYKERLKVCNILPVRGVREGSVNPDTIPSSSDNRSEVESGIAEVLDNTDAKQQAAEFSTKHTLQGAQLEESGRMMETESFTSGQTSELPTQQLRMAVKRKSSESELQSTSRQEIESDSEEKVQDKRRKLDSLESRRETTPMSAEIKGQSVSQSVRQAEAGSIQSGNADEPEREQPQGVSVIQDSGVANNQQIGPF